MSMCVVKVGFRLNCYYCFEIKGFILHDGCDLIWSKAALTVSSGHMWWNWWNHLFVFEIIGKEDFNKGFGSPKPYCSILGMPSLPCAPLPCWVARAKEEHSPAILRVGDSCEPKRLLVACQPFWSCSVCWFLARRSGCGWCPAASPSPSASGSRSPSSARWAAPAGVCSSPCTPPWRWRGRRLQRLTKHRGSGSERLRFLDTMFVITRVQ